MGGTIALLGWEVVLAGAVVDASGANGGGRIFIGVLQRGIAAGDAQTVTVTAATQLRADARGQGDGGRVLVWADQTTEFAGSVSARGGARWGDGGLVEVSAGGTLTDGGAVTWGSGTAGVSGTVSAANSLIGANSGDRLHFAALLAIFLGSPAWRRGRRGTAGIPANLPGE